MAVHCTTSFIYLLFLFLADTIAELDSTKSHYIELGLNTEAVCHPSKYDVRVLNELRRVKDSAIMIKPSHVFDSWVGVIKHKRCNFTVKATKGDGLFAVIHRMSFRRNGSECLDYIKFTAGNDIHTVEEKYCGKLDTYNGIKRYIPTVGLAEYEMRNPDYQNGEEYTIGMFEKFSAVGKITTEIFISRTPLNPGETLDLIVTYTPYKDCRNAGPGFVNVGHHSMSGFFFTPSNICIHNKFVCDGYANCASLVCADEFNCTSVVSRIISDGTGTKVTVSAVTTIFLCFIIFVLCLWICRKHKKLCWSPDCAGPPVTVSGSTSGSPMEHGEQNAPNPAPYVPTAPMLEVAVPASLHDKDLPPSYDSLFPSQANSANT